MLKEYKGARGNEVIFYGACFIAAERLAVDCLSYHCYGTLELLLLSLSPFLSGNVDKGRSNRTIRVAAHCTNVILSIASGNNIPPLKLLATTTGRRSLLIKWKL